MTSHKAHTFTSKIDFYAALNAFFDKGQFVVTGRDKDVDNKPVWIILEN